MKKYNRRKIIKLMFKGIIGSSLFPIFSCNENKSVLEPLLQTTLNSSPEMDLSLKIVDNFCNNNLSGEKLVTSKNSLSKTINYSEAKPGWDSVNVVKNYELLSAINYDNYIIVKVKFYYYGRIKGETWFPYNPITNNDRYLIFNFKVLKTKNSGLSLHDYIPPICSRDNVLNHLKRLILKNKSKNSNDNNCMIRLNNLRKLESYLQNL